MKRLLYIDDELDTEPGRIKIESLVKAGFSVKPAKGPREALEALEVAKGEYDLILLDILMPFGSLYCSEETNHGTNTGLRLLSDIRKQYQIPVILITVKPKAQVRSAMKEHRVEGYLYKPVLPSDLVAAVRKVFGSS